MTDTPAQPTSLVLEVLRQMRADAVEFRSEVSAEFKSVRQEMTAGFAKLEKEMSILRRQTIGEVYRSNKTFASFSDLEARLEALERKVFA